jgi:DNA-binding CsgD family transcriptional regulator
LSASMNNNNYSSNNNNHSSSSLEWRRSKVQELASQGYNQSEISRILQISQPTINRDLSYLRQQAKSNIKRYIDERLPEEYEKCLVGLTAILKEAWTTSQNTEDKKEKHCH